MKNVLVNFSKRAIDNIRSAMGPGAALDTFDTITELNNSLVHGGNYDKALLWHTYPVEESPQVMAEYAEELEQLAGLLSRSTEAPEVWVMEKTREACAYDYERLSSVADLAIVHIATMGGIGPVLQSALGSTISAIKVNKSLVGLYGEAEYNEDMEQTMASFDDDDEFEGDGADEFEEAGNDFDDGDFEDASPDEFEDADAEEFEDASADDFTEDDFETEDDSDVADEFEEAEPEPAEFEEAEPEPAVAPPPKPASPLFDEVDEFEGESSDFEEEDENAPVAPQEPYGDDEVAFGEPNIATFDDSEFEETPTAPAFAGGFDDVDEFEAKTVEDFDDFEETPAPAPAPVTPVGVEDMSGADEFAGAPVSPAPVPMPVPVAEPPKKKKGLFGKKEKPAPVVASAPTPEQTAQALDDAQVAAVENAELSKSALNVLKSVCSKRCCQITVTGERGSGKSTVAANLGNILSKHFKVLVVDMDGETRGISYIQNDIIQNIAPEEPGMRSIFSAGLNSGNKPFNVRNNMAISTVGLASDTFKTNEVFTVNNVSRAHSQLTKTFDFIIYDIPLDAALDKLANFVTTSYILYCVEASNYGFMNLLFRIGNLEDGALAQQITENAIIVPTKSSGYSYVGNIPVKNTKQALKAVQSIGDELVGGECELDFASMEFAAALPFDPKVQQVVGSKHFYSDTGKGFKEYSKLIASVFGL